MNRNHTVAVTDSQEPQATKRHQQVKNSKYEYEKLSCEYSLRLFELHPGTENEKLNGQLLLANIEDTPSYEAISYVWGDPNNTTEITCSSRRLTITVNLADALKKVRDTEKPRLLWADAICINQKDTLERGHQVKLMRDIFKKAKRVLAWVGACGDDATSVSLLVQALAKMDNPSTSDSQAADTPQMRWVIWNSTGMGYPDRIVRIKNDYIAEWDALSKMLRQTFFHRAWIVQEIGLAAEALLLYGSATIKFDDLFAALKSTKKCTLECSVDIADSLLPVFAYRARLQRPLQDAGISNFLLLLDTVRNCQATDPRDHIFAFLSHPSVQAEDGPLFEVNYNKPWPQVFQELAHRLIEKLGTDLQVLSCVEHTQVTLSDPKMPSWVPRWHQRRINNNLTTTAYGSVGCPPQSRSSRISGSSLWVCGLILDRVDYCSEVYLREVILMNTPLSNRVHPVEATITDILPLRIKASYPELQTAPDLEEGRLEIFARTLTAGANGLTGSQCRDRLRAYRSHLRELSLRESAAEEALQQPWTSQDENQFGIDAHPMCSNRRFFTTEKGYYGLGPSLARKGDLVCILFGAKMPFILRKSGDYYKLVGESYVHGTMGGEAIEMWEQGLLQEQQFEIQ